MRMQIAQSTDGRILWCFDDGRPRRFVITQGADGDREEVSERHAFEALCGIRNGNGPFEDWQANGDPDELLDRLFP